jgi:hypothetical protein
MNDKTYRIERGRRRRRRADMRRGADRRGTGRRLVQPRVRRRVRSDGQQRKSRVDGSGRLPLRLVLHAVHVHRSPELASVCGRAKVLLLLNIHLLWKLRRKARLKLRLKLMLMLMLMLLKLRLLKRVLLEL